MAQLPEYVDDLPNLCGSEEAVDAAVQRGHERTTALNTRAD